MVSYGDCVMCPRECHADRSSGKFGYCLEGDRPHLAWAGLHKGEEPPVSGKNGSGMFFFRGCPLGCPFCQNHEISLPAERDSVFCPPISVEDAVAILDDMVSMGAESISFVTAEHFVPFVAEVSSRMKADGIGVPLVFNTSGWISTDSVADLLPFVDIWLWDIKTHDADTAGRFCGSGRYPEEERKSFAFLMDRLSDFDIEVNRRGVIVRHLVLPGEKAASLEVIRDFMPFRDKCWFSLMSQFVNPFSGLSGGEQAAVDYAEVEKFMIECGIENGFVQEEGDESLWIPDFRRENPFPDDFAIPSQAFLELRRKAAKLRK